MRTHKSNEQDDKSRANANHLQDRSSKSNAIRIFTDNRNLAATQRKLIQMASKDDNTQNQIPSKAEMDASNQRAKEKNIQELKKMYDTYSDIASKLPNKQSELYRERLKLKIKMDAEGKTNTQEHNYAFQEILRKAREIYKSETGKDYKD